MRTEGDKRLNSDAAAREARDARSRCEELSRILDHQTRITDALSHEMASIRGRVEIKDLRQDRKDRNVLPWRPLQANFKMPHGVWVMPPVENFQPF